MSLLSSRNNGWENGHKMYYIARLRKHPEVRAIQFRIIVSLFTGEYEIHTPKDLPHVIPCRMVKVGFE